MFEKEAEEYADKNKTRGGSSSFGDITNYHDLREGFIAGAEYGYNKANEWHDIKEIEPSKEQLGKHLLIKMESVTGDTDYAYIVYKYNGESMSDVIGVLAWKEIVLPELKEIE